jgi:hypothetical protein
MSTVQQSHQLGKGSITFIVILAVLAIAAPFIIVNKFNPKEGNIVEESKQAPITEEENKPQLPQTYSAANFRVFGNAVNDGKWVSDIGAGGGFRFTVKSSNATAAKLHIQYKSENQCGTLKINGVAENLYFPKTDGKWTGDRNSNGNDAIPVESYGGYKHKTVIVQLQRGENAVEFCGGWITDFAPLIAGIRVEPGDFRKDYFTGVWEGKKEEGDRYSHVSYQWKLTVNDDLTGIKETVSNRTGSYTYHKGTHKYTYSVKASLNEGRIGVYCQDMISRSGEHSDSQGFDGTIINGIFCGKDFKFEKSGTQVLLPVSSDFKYTFVTEANNWHSVSFDDSQWQQGSAPFGNMINEKKDLPNTRWTTSQIYIRKSFNINNLNNLTNAYFSLWHDDEAEIYINGKLEDNYSGKTTNYNTYWVNKSFLKNGENVIAVKCIQNDGDQLIDIGVFASTKKPMPVVIDDGKDNDDVGKEAVSDTTDKENKNNIKVDYSAKVESALSKAINACENGDWDDAYKYYTEAANYTTNRSSQIKQDAANKFKEKAERVIANNNGKCDDFAKKLLRHANNLYSSKEIRNLLNKCGETASVSSSGSGRFPQGSQRLLSSSDLSGLSKYDLRIMRNEIFARHGYIFTTAEMKNYFSKQSWYTPRYGNVTSMLTNIEQKNIELIKSYE